MNYNDFVRTVAGATALTRKQADEAVVTTLTVMAEVISAGETQDLLAQLPKSFRERVPVSAETTPMRPIEFVARVSDLVGVPLEDAERNARAVFDVLTKAVNAGEMADIADELGDEYAGWLGREVRPRATTRVSHGAVDETASEPAMATVSPLVPPAPPTTPVVVEIPQARVVSPLADAAVAVGERVLGIATWPVRVTIRSIGRLLPVLR